MTYRQQQQTVALLIESKFLKKISGPKRNEAGYWNNTDYTARNTVCSHVCIHFTEAGKLFQTQSVFIICTIRAKKGEAFEGKFTELVKKTSRKETTWEI
jgi:hypothetical protein